MRLCLISDTHGQHRSMHIPEADVLVHAGDISMRGEPEVIRDFGDWIHGLPHKYKVVIAGNHDFLFEQDKDRAIALLGADDDVIYLEDSWCQIDGFKFYGSPVQPEFCNWAFNRKRGAEINEYWKKIPKDTDVLITHGPPFGILDRATPNGPKLGCEDLARRCNELTVPLHVFGHIHGGYGKEEQGVLGSYTRLSVNASMLDEQYRHTAKHQAVELEIQRGGPKSRVYYYDRYQS